MRNLLRKRDFGETFLMIIGGIVVIAFSSVLGGTIIYWFWPHVIPFVFPAAVTAGTIVGKIAWGKAVLLTWMCGLLFKSSGSATNNR